MTHNAVIKGRRVRRRRKIYLGVVCFRVISLQKEVSSLPKRGPKGIRSRTLSVPVSLDYRWLKIMRDKLDGDS